MSLFFDWYFLLIYFSYVREKITTKSIYSEKATKIWPFQKTWTLSRRSWDQKISYFICPVSFIFFYVSSFFFTRVSLRMQKLSSSQKGLLSMRHTSAFGRKLNWCSVVSKIRYLGWYLLSLSRACPSKFWN